MTGCIVYLYIHQGRLYCTDWLYFILVCIWREIVLYTCMYIKGEIVMYWLVVLYACMYMKEDCTVLTGCIVYLYIHEGRLYCTDWFYCIPVCTWREIVLYWLVVLCTCMYMKGDCTVLTDCIVYLYVHEGRLYCTDWLYRTPVCTWREIVLYWLIVLYTCMYMKGDSTVLTDCIVYLYVHKGRLYYTDWLNFIPVCTWREIVLYWLVVLYTCMYMKGDCTRLTGCIVYLYVHEGRL